MSRARKSSIALLAITALSAMCAALLGLAPASAGNGPMAPTGRFMQRMTSANMASHAYTEAEAVDMARRFDVITANRGQFRPFVAKMREANPRLALLVYFNGSFAQKSQGTAYPESWYLRDANGNKVTSTGWGNYAMNPANPEWVATRADECIAAIADSGYDGCFIDMLGTAPLDPGYLTALPINPATGQVWTRAEWLKATAEIAAAVERKAGDRPVVGNGLGNGQRYFNTSAPSSTLLPPEDGGMAEAWLRHATAGIDHFKTETAWRGDVDMLADAGAKSRPVMAMTKVWVAGTEAQKDRWHKYTLASFLLGNDGRSYLSFLRDNTPWVTHRWDFVDVGTPEAAYGKWGGVYVRPFTNGLALVNPTTSSVTVTLSGTFTTLDGVEVTSLTMGANTGEVLTKVASSTEEPEPTTTTTAPPTTTTTVAPTTTTTVAPDDVSLTYSWWKAKGTKYVELEWSGASSSSVVIFRNGHRLTSTANDGLYTDTFQHDGKATYRYKVCNANVTACSPEKTVTFK
jgi:hypothetical protein